MAGAATRRARTRGAAVDRAARDGAGAPRVAGPAERRRGPIAFGPPSFAEARAWLGGRVARHRGAGRLACRPTRGSPVARHRNAGPPCEVRDSALPSVAVLAAGVFLLGHLLLPHHALRARSGA